MRKVFTAKKNFTQFFPLKSESLFDVCCIVSLIGIWPRFIEPNLVNIKKLGIEIPTLPPLLNGFKILQISDLHIKNSSSALFFQKVSALIKKNKPDVIAITGDLICVGRLENQELLKDFLNSLSAPYGIYAVFGNHDYDEYVSINTEGEYDVIKKETSLFSLVFSRFFTSISLKKFVTHSARQTKPHKELISLLSKTPLQILHNETIQIPIQDTFLNLTGLGEYITGKCLPDVAFKEYDLRFPGIVLSHNPDSYPLLKDFPGDLILCGHTHGGQVNLPWISKKITLMENPQLEKGLHHLEKKFIYINRGLGAPLRFRLFAPPEITLFSLKSPQQALK